MKHTTTPSSLAMQLQSFWRWLTATPQAGKTVSATPATTLRSQLMQSSANDRHLARTRPLRVLQVVESGPGSAQSGRLRISGRMADVCAELDRLAAREALQG